MQRADLRHRHRRLREHLEQEGLELLVRAVHLDRDASGWQDEVNILLEGLLLTKAAVVLVSEETGWGVVPVTAAGGRFRDRLGELQQRLTPHCAAAWLVLQGRAIDLATLGRPVPEGLPSFGASEDPLDSP